MITHNGKQVTLAMRNRKPISLIARNGKAIWDVWVHGNAHIDAAAKAVILAEYGKQVWSDVKQYAKAHPQIVEFINQDPHLACSISPNSNKERWLIIPQSKSAGYYNGITLPYSWNVIGRVDMKVQWLTSETTNGILWFSCWNNKPVAPYWGTNWTNGFSNVKVVGDTNYRNAGERSITFTCSESVKKAQILGWDSGIAPVIQATHFTIYGTDNTTKLMELVPCVYNNEVVFVDLLTGHICRNSGTGQFTIAITDKE